MKRAPVAVIVAAPASLPVFDDSWKAKCRTCASYRENREIPTQATMLCDHIDCVPRFGRASKVSCGDARQAGAACGPGAKLWEPAR